MGNLSRSRTASRPGSYFTRFNRSAIRVCQPGPFAMSEPMRRSATGDRLASELRTEARFFTGIGLPHAENVAPRRHGATDADFTLA